MSDKETPLTKEEQLAELVWNLKPLGIQAVRSFVRTGMAYLLGRKIAPQIFTGFGRTYALVLLIDLIKSKRMVQPAKAGKEATATTTINTTEGPAIKLRSATFKVTPPDISEGHAKGDNWYVMSGKDSTKILETYVYDGKSWVKLDTSSVRF